MFEKQEKSPEEYWREFEEKRGEKVLAYAIGWYLSGWPEEEAPLPRGTAPWSGLGGTLCGLLIATEGGFVFHHFPHVGWLESLSLTRGAGREQALDITLFIAKERLLSVEFAQEPSLLKRLFSAKSPQVRLCYQTASGAGETFIAVSDAQGEEVVRQLAAVAAGGGIGERL